LLLGPSYYHLFVHQPNMIQASHLQKKIGKAGVKEGREQII